MNSTEAYLNDLGRFFPAITGAALSSKYFGGSWEKMLEAVRAAQARGLIEVSTELVRGRRTAEPIAVIRAGEIPPLAGHIAYEGSRRWSETVAPTLVIRGTAKLSAFYGGEPRVIAAGHLSHELALSDVFLVKRDSNPDFEWTLVRQSSGGGSIPDAISASAYIELVGRYSGASVAAKLALAGSVSLELW